MIAFHNCFSNWRDRLVQSISAFIVLLSAFFCGPSIAQPLGSGPIEDVYLASVSMVGDFEKLPYQMPLTYGLYANDQFRSQLNQRVAQAVQGGAEANPGMRFIINDQVLQSDDSYALTFALSGESVTSIATEGKVFVDYVVQALVLIANVSKDPDRQRVVASYPVQVKRTVLYPQGVRIGPEEGRKVMADLLLGRGGEVDLVAEWRKRLLAARLKNRDVWVAVAPLKINTEAAQRSGLTAKPQLLASTIAKSSSLIEANISRAANIPIVPGGLDESLGQLSVRFGDKPVAFKLPQPSKVMTVTAYVLGSSSAEETLVKDKKFMTMFVGGFQVDYETLTPDQKRINEFSLRLQKQDSIFYIGATKESRQFEESEQFARLISAFSDELPMALIPANASWLDKYKAGSEKKSGEEMAKLIRTHFPSR